MDAAEAEALIEGRMRLLDYWLDGRKRLHTCPHARDTDVLFLIHWELAGPEYPWLRCWECHRAQVLRESVWHRGWTTTCEMCGARGLCEEATYATRIVRAGTKALGHWHGEVRCGPLVQLCAGCTARVGQAEPDDSRWERRVREVAEWLPAQLDAGGDVPEACEHVVTGEAVLGIVCRECRVFVRCVECFAGHQRGHSPVEDVSCLRCGAGDGSEPRSVMVVLKARRVARDLFGHVGSLPTSVAVWPAAYFCRECGTRYGKVPFPVREP